MLEVNSQPGLSFERNTSSTADILHLAGESPRRFVRTLIEHALRLADS